MHYSHSLAMVLTQANSDKAATPILLDFESAKLSCPSGWYCNGDAAVSSTSYAKNKQGSRVFVIGFTDRQTGSATSAIFGLPANTAKVIFKRGGGSDTGGVRIHLAADNSLICEAIDGINTDVMFDDECNVDGYAGQEVYIYAWDCDRGGYGKVWLDHFRFVNESSSSTLTGTLFGRAVSTRPPLPTSCDAQVSMSSFLES